MNEFRYFTDNSTGGRYRAPSSGAWGDGSARWDRDRSIWVPSRYRLSLFIEQGVARFYTETDSTGAPLAGDASAEPIHKRVFEYDGAFWCRDCGAQWGALTGKPVMPDMCQQAAAPAASGEEEPAPVRGDVHSLKTLPSFFEQVAKGNKRFEIRKDDRGFKLHDTLWLQEWNHKEGYTGRDCRARVTYLTDWEQKPGYVVMSIEILPPATAPDAGLPSCGHAQADYTCSSCVDHEIELTLRRGKARASTPPAEGETPIVADAYKQRDGESHAEHMKRQRQTFQSLERANQGLRAAVETLLEIGITCTAGINDAEFEAAKDHLLSLIGTDLKTAAAGGEEGKDV